MLNMLADFFPRTCTERQPVSRSSLRILVASTAGFQLPGVSEEVIGVPGLDLLEDLLEAG